MMHSLPPALPATWLASIAEPASEGSYRTWIVIRAGESVNDAYRVHKAIWNDDRKEWYYESGDYIMQKNDKSDRELWWEAVVKFARRAGIAAAVVF